MKTYVKPEIKVDNTYIDIVLSSTFVTDVWSDDLLL